MIIKMLRGCCAGINRLVYFVGFSASLLMPVLALTVAYEVFARYVLNAPTVWAYDVSLFIFGYVAALCAALAQQRRDHINVDVIFLAVPYRVRALFNLMTYLLAAFFLVVIIRMSHEKLLEAIEYDFRRQSEWAPSMVHFWVMMLTGSALFVLQYISDFIQSFYYLVTGRVLIPGTETDIIGDAEHHHGGM